MASYNKIQLSGATDGRSISVDSTASTAGTAIHTAGSTSQIDEVWLWATNTGSASKKITVQFGGVTDPDDLVEFYVPPEDGPYLLIPGWTLTNSLAIKAYAETADLININGYVNRIA